MAQPSAAERDARLDQLSSAVKDWADRRVKYLNDQVAFSRRVLNGRNSAQRLNDVTSKQASLLAVDELDQFLTGE